MCGVGYLRFNCGHLRMMWQDCELAGDRTFYIRHACPNFNTHTKLSNQLCGSGPGHHCSQTPGGKLVEEGFDFFKPDGPLLRLKKLNAKVERVARAIQALLLQAQLRGLSRLEADNINRFNRLKASFDKAYKKRNLLIAEKCRFERLIMTAENHYQLQDGPPDASTATPEFPLALQHPGISEDLAQQFAVQRDRAILKMMPYELALNSGLLHPADTANIGAGGYYTGLQPRQTCYQYQHVQQMAGKSTSSLPPPARSSQQGYSDRQYHNSLTQQQNTSQASTQQVRQPKRKRPVVMDAVGQVAKEDGDPVATARRNQFMGLFQSYQQQSRDKVAAAMIEGGYNVKDMYWYSANHSQTKKLQSVQEVSEGLRKGRPKSRGSNLTSRNTTTSAVQSTGLRRSTRTRGSNIKYNESPSSAAGWSSEDPSPVKSVKSDAAWLDDGIEASEDSGSPMKRRSRRQTSSEMATRDANSAHGAHSSLAEKILAHKRLAEQVPSFPSQRALVPASKSDPSGRSSDTPVPNVGKTDSFARVRHSTAVMVPPGLAYAGNGGLSMGPPQYSKSFPSPVTQSAASRMRVMPMANMYTQYAEMPPPSRRVPSSNGTVPGDGPQFNNQGLTANIPHSPQLGSYWMAPNAACEDPFFNGPSQAPEQQLRMESLSNLVSPKNLSKPDVRTAAPSGGTMQLLTSGYQPHDRSAPRPDNRGQWTGNPSHESKYPYEPSQNIMGMPTDQADILFYPESSQNYATDGMSTQSNQPSNGFEGFGATTQPSLAAPFPSLTEHSVVNLPHPTNSPYPDYERMQRSFSATTQLTPHSTASDGTDPQKRSMAAPSPTSSLKEHVRLSFPGYDNVPVLPTNVAGFDNGVDFLNAQLPAPQTTSDSAYASQDQLSTHPPAAILTTQFSFAPTADMTTDHRPMHPNEPKQEVRLPQLPGTTSGEPKPNEREAQGDVSGNASDAAQEAFPGFDPTLPMDELDWAEFTEDWTAMP